MLPLTQHKLSLNGPVHCGLLKYIVVVLLVMDIMPLIPQIHIITTQEIGRVHHRRINIEEPTGTCYTDCIIIYNPVYLVANW